MTSREQEEVACVRICLFRLPLLLCIATEGSLIRVLRDGTMVMLDSGLPPINWDMLPRGTELANSRLVRAIASVGDNVAAYIFYALFGSIINVVIVSRNNIPVFPRFLDLRDLLGKCCCSTNP